MKSILSTDAVWASPARSPGKPAIFRSVLLWAFLLVAGSLAAQNIYRDWIDYSKTYYKFPVAPLPVHGFAPNNHYDGGDYHAVRRIAYSTLQAAGLQAVPAEHFQLWRNGREVALYVSPATGPIGPDGYLEFWGEGNDGLPDSALYQKPTHQQNNRWSLFTDTAMYFLTVNTQGNNKRISDQPHTPLQSALLPEPWFRHTIRINPRGSRNMGYALVSSDGKALRSSAFDEGEGWGDTRTGSSSYIINLSRLFPARFPGADMTLQYSAAGHAYVDRQLRVLLNDTLAGEKSFYRFTPDSVTYPQIPISRINPTNDSLHIRWQLVVSNPSDRFYLAKCQLTYPRQFRFDKRISRFAFTLPASASPQLLKLVDFDTSADAKILLDLTNLRRYQAVRVADTLWIELQPSATARQLVLYTNRLSGGVWTIPNLQPRQFLNLNDAAQRGDYLIISNPLLYNDNGQNRVEEYRAYRSSVAGGGYQARVYDIGELTDQFAFGIFRHPLAIRNFLNYARASFSTPPKAVLLLGRSATYDKSTTDINFSKLDFLPTWGQPASDNLLAAASNQSPVPATPIGRIAAITGAEVKDYLDKVKEFEQLQQNPEANTTWQKEALHLIGGSDQTIVAALKFYMDGYKSTISDTLVGAQVDTYVRLNDPNTAANNEAIRNRIAAGTSLVSYFGHSSATSFDFNLNNPAELGNSGGKYPLFIANGCNAAEFFDLAPQRIGQQQLTLSERFVLAPHSGAIGFISNTHYGVPQYLHLYTRNWYNALSKTHYGQPLGVIHQVAVQRLLAQSTATDFTARLTAEEYQYHGDPAIRMHTKSQPDYLADSIGIQFTPAYPNLLTDTVLAKVVYYNQGKAVFDSLQLRVKRLTPDGQEEILLNTRRRAARFSDTVWVKIPVRGPKDAGWNSLVVQVDAGFAVNELNEENNLTTRRFLIAREGVKPVYPQAYGILHTWPQTLYGSTVDAQAGLATYILEMDTTTTFQSGWLYSAEKTAGPGVISFAPTKPLTPGTVYYWRIRQSNESNTDTTAWSSFTYLPNDSTGFNQQHAYQHLRSGYQGVSYDNTSRRFLFTPRDNNLYIDHGIYPTSGTEDSHFSVTTNGITPIYSACVGRSIIFNVFDSLSFAPWLNTSQRFGSGPNCGKGREYNFEFSYFPSSNRKKIMDFLDSIPKGFFVVARMVLDPDPGQPGFPEGKADSAHVAYWQRDTAIFGAGNSLYHKLRGQGFYSQDSINRPRTFAFVFRKDDAQRFVPRVVISDGLYDRAVLSVDLGMQDTSGTVTSPIFGPARQWQGLHWRAMPAAPGFDPAVDSATLLVLSPRPAGGADTLKVLRKSQQDLQFTGPDSIDAKKYPYLQLRLLTTDPRQGTPYPLHYWRLNFMPAPEGAVVPGEYLEWTRDKVSGLVKDTLNAQQGDSLKFGIAFRNISQTPFADSIEVTLVLEDASGSRITLPKTRVKALMPGDSAHLDFAYPATYLVGKMRLFAGFNKGLVQPELDPSNNAYYREFFVVNPDLANGQQTKVFSGTGYWSESQKWFPAGVPACGEKVIIQGNCTVDLASATADSLTVMPEGRLQLALGGALTLGCIPGGGNKLMKVLGNYTMSGGLLRVNGGLFFANGSQFMQSGGDIILDANGGNNANALVLDTLSTAAQGPAGILAFGGNNGSPGHWLNPMTTGTFQVSGGSITIVDPPLADTGYALYVRPSGTSSLSFGGTHVLTFGNAQPGQAHASRGTGFGISVRAASANEGMTLRNLTVAGGTDPRRKAFTAVVSPFLLRVTGHLRVLTPSILVVGPGTGIIQGPNGGN